MDDDAITKWVATGTQFKETNRSRNNGSISYELREALRMNNYMTPDYAFEVLYGVGTDAHYVAPGIWHLMPGIDRIIFNNPATIVYWTDGTKTVVKAHDEEFSEEHGLAMAFARKVLESYGNKHPRAGFKRLVREAKHY